MASDIERMAAVIEQHLGFTNGWYVSADEYRKLCEAAAQQIVSGPTPAVGAAGEVVAWWLGPHDEYVASATASKSAAKIAETLGATIRTLVFGDIAHPSAGAVTEAEQDKIEQAEGERIFDRVCEALKLDPNDGDCDSGDHADFIVSAVQRHIERLSVAHPSAGAGVTDEMVEAGIRVGRDWGFFDWSEEPTSRYKAMREVLTAALHRPTSEGREDV